MKELTISDEYITGKIDDYVSSFTTDTVREEIGTVIDAGDGIAHVEGLPSVMKRRERSSGRVRAASLRATVAAKASRSVAT